ncbi:hypothetical protein [Georgenia thermotolerans]|uniref:Uncharacterized protein n=1 Tax=Georgenia thermotolerans TaxID=527326 RepID=A0A7J5UNR2_9MICO|nr:hypothetical protein [Georgenia thermotolerans]KAE8764042.1 hypothetical protein GB883_11000 [Georgenia thermotolerans]
MTTEAWVAVIVLAALAVLWLVVALRGWRTARRAGLSGYWTARTEPVSLHGAQAAGSAVATGCVDGGSAAGDC